ncbi:MAG TPA: hypothetical protein VNZ66_09580, partial [Aeromicrobium sp.]|nr:hypothetical protein [Aeromicrobium sp.]
PGCVAHGLPQAQRVHKLFHRDDLVVVGLHTVFEHHDAMTAVALRAFLHEYRVAFPVAIDQPGTHGPIPVTMERFAMQGTPTVMLYDRTETLRLQHFGHIPDMQLGVEVTRLQQQPREPAR